MEYMPKSVRQSLIRKKIRVDESEIPSNLLIKVADTQEELEAAYRILYEAYLEYGYQKQEPEKMRIVKYFALPTTTTLVAKIEDQVVGTVTLIRKNSLGLPMEKEFNLSKHIGPDKSVVEVSSLAISSGYRHKRGTIFLPLCVYIYNYLKHYVSVDYMAIAVNPAWVDFYEGLLLFSQIQRSTIGKYDFANGAPAVGLISEIKSLNDRWAPYFSHRPDNQNLIKFMNKMDQPFYKWPVRLYEKAMDPVLTPEMIEYFFVHKSRVLEQLDDFEYRTLRSYYSHEQYSSLFPDLRQRYRETPRYLVNLSGQTPKNDAIYIQDVSEKGLKVKGQLVKGESLSIQVQVARDLHSQLKATVVWKDEATQTAGLRIEAHDDIWQDYMSYLRTDLVKTPA